MSINPEQPEKAFTLQVSDTERDGLPWRQTVATACEMVAEHGCLVLKNLFPREFIVSLAESFFAADGSRSDEDLLSSSQVVGPRRVMFPLPLRAPFDQQRFFANPMLGAILSVLLGEDLVLDSCSLVMALPGADAQRLHLDDQLPFGDSKLSLQMPPLAVTVGIPLIDLDQATGTTALFPGSHRRLIRYDKLSSEEAVNPYLSLGDAYLFDYRLAHAGTPNRSAQRRPLIYLVYARTWYLDTANHLDLGMPWVIIDDDTLAQLAKPYQYLLRRSQLQLKGKPVWRHSANPPDVQNP